MNLTNAWIIALAGLTAAGLATWAWLVSARVMEELRSFDSFKGMHFEE
jgi:hypothetical protein